VTAAANHVHFFLAYPVSFVAFGLIAKWYLLPALERHPLPTGLSPLLLYACSRVNGLTLRPSSTRSTRRLSAPPS